MAKRDGALTMELVTHPNDVLSQRSEKVEDFDQDLQDLASEMIRVMNEGGGVGLAANQVGALQRVIVVKNSDRTRDVVMVNPKLVKRSPKMREEHEGCLSFPGKRVWINRHRKVTVEFQTLQGEKKRILAVDFVAACVQHEIDHLNGKLIQRYYSNE